jgi:hypothetical protein
MQTGSILDKKVLELENKQKRQQYIANANNIASIKQKNAIMKIKL